MQNIKRNIIIIIVKFKFLLKHTVFRLDKAGLSAIQNEQLHWGARPLQTPKGYIYTRYIYFGNLFGNMHQSINSSENGPKVALLLLLRALSCRGTLGQNLVLIFVSFQLILCFLQKL